MSAILKPADHAQLLEAVAWARAEQRPLEVVGTGSKRGLGRPLQVAHTLDVSALAGVTLYEPNELVMSAKAGTPLADIQALLDENRQQLAFEPADYGPLLGGAAGQGSVGGVFAANLAGPRRIAAGAARDHILGVHCVSGRGEAFRAGGRVVKNVTGFDLPKLLAGSYGTLAVIEELTFKVLPRPAKVRTVLVVGLDEARSVAAMTQAFQSSHEVSAAAYVPATMAAGSKAAHVAGAGASVTAVRVEGPEPSVAHRCASLRRELAGFGPTEELHTAQSRLLWSELRDVAPFVGDGRAVWRLALPPANAPTVVAGITRTVDADFYFDRGGGQVWMAVADGADAGAEAIRAGVAPTGGSATLVRAGAERRAHVEVFQPQPEPLRRLTARVKDAFDPSRILNPGRMYAGL
jgi:glycolate oxidase FAD binding subunit